MNRRDFLVTASACPLFSQAVQAAARPLLTVTGIVSGNEVHFDFDREALEEIDWVELETYTAFTNGPQKFAGPRLQRVLDHVGLSGRDLLASALNDYTVSILSADIKKHDPILALDHNGHRMRIRDKGPIWVVFPLTQECVEKKLYEAEMIWQLARLTVV